MNNNYYDSEEEVAWGRVTLKEMKHELLKKPPQQIKRRQTDTGHLPQCSIINETSESDKSDKADQSGYSHYYTPDQSLKDPANSRNNTFLQKLAAVVQEPEQEEADHSLSYATAMDTSASTSKPVDDTLLNILKSGDRGSCILDQFHQSLVENSVQLTPGTATVETDDEVVILSDDTDVDSSFDCSATPTQIQVKSEAFEVGEIIDLSSESEADTPDKMIDLTQKEAEETLSKTTRDLSLSSPNDSLNNIVHVSKKQLEAPPSDQNDLPIPTVPDSNEVARKSSLRNSRGGYRLDMSLSEGMMSENDRVSGLKMAQFFRAGSLPARSPRSRNPGSDCSIMHSEQENNGFTEEDRCGYFSEEDRAEEKSVNLEDLEAESGFSTGQFCEEEETSGVEFNLESSNISGIDQLDESGKESFVFDASMEDQNQLQKQLVFDASVEEDPLQLDTTVQESLNQLEKGSLVFDDTMEEMEMALKQGLDYKMPTDEASTIPLSPTVTESKSDKQLPKKKSPSPKKKYNYVASPVGDYIKGKSPVDQEFKLPILKPPKPKATLALPRTPLSGKQAYKNIVSPVRIYINNSPSVVCLKQNIPNRNITKLESPPQKEIIKSNKENCPSKIPQVIYRPAKKVVTTTCQEIVLPSSIKKLVTEPTIVKHNARININQLNDTKIEQNLMAGDLTAASSSLLDQTGDVSFMTKKQAFIK